MSSGGSVTSSRVCCENGRPIMTDPHTGQTICSCQYGTALLNYSRVQSLQEGVYGTSAAAAAAYAASAAQGYVPLGPEGSAFYSPLVSVNTIVAFQHQNHHLLPNHYLTHRALSSLMLLLSLACCCCCCCCYYHVSFLLVNYNLIPK